MARGAARSGEEEQRELLHLIAFELADASYALRVDSVREIVRMRPITPIPRVAEAVRGVISLRGEIIQVLDLRRRLRLAPRDPTRSSRIVVVHLEDGRVAGLLVDAVREVLRVPADSVLPPTMGDTRAVDALCQRAGGFVSLLALDRVFDVDAEV